MSFFLDLHSTDYKSCYDLQQQAVAQRISGELEQDLFLITEHSSVYTLGKRGGAQHFHVPETFLEQKGINVVHIERGGEVTYHGPNQLVLYPIFHLRHNKMRVTDYVWHLEEVMIRICAHFGLKAVRNCKNPGVWTEDGRAKIGSIGIAIRHGVSFHGLALNVCPDLEPFSWISPCGLSGVVATSMAKELQKEVTMIEVKLCLHRVLQDIFGECSELFPTHNLAQYI